ncbi:MAG: hypothetical protein AB7N65_28215 [Vicinamibacterales bacterium]
MSPRIVYCHCAFARIVPAPTRAAVLDGLARSDRPFEAVPDLCEMAARKDPRLAELATSGAVRIAACYPRAVRWLFASAGAPLETADATVLNMRLETPDAILDGLLAEDGAR